MRAWKDSTSLTTLARTRFLHSEYLSNTHKPGDWSSKGSCCLSIKLPFPSHLIGSPKEHRIPSSMAGLRGTYTMCSSWGQDPPPAPSRSQGTPLPQQMLPHGNGGEGVEDMEEWQEHQSKKSRRTAVRGVLKAYNFSCISEPCTNLQSLW